MTDNTIYRCECGNKPDPSDNFCSMCGACMCFDIVDDRDLTLDDIFVMSDEEILTRYCELYALDAEDSVKGEFLKKEIILRMEEEKVNERRWA
jgi:hypothetical protein